jgi:hypothetical protein
MWLPTASCGHHIADVIRQTSRSPHSGSDPCLIAKRMKIIDRPLNPHIRNNFSSPETFCNGPWQLHVVTHEQHVVTNTSGH